METAANPGRAANLPPSAFSAAPAGDAPQGVGTSDAHAASFLAPFERVLATFKRMSSNYATLAVLDVRRAAVQFAWLIAGGIFIAVLVVTAWLAAVVALAVWLIGSGMSWPAVLLIAAALNLAGAVIVGLRLRNVFDHVPFEATLRQLKAEDPEKTGAEVK